MKTLSSKNHDALTRRRDELKQRLAAIEKDYARGLSADAEERAQELENAETLAEIARVITQELEQIEKTLTQIK